MKEILIEFGLNIVLGVVSGIVASIIFLLSLRKMRPKICISRHIVLKDDIYYFKFVNKSRHDLFDIKLEASLLTPFGDINGQNLRAVDIKLMDEVLFHIPKNQKDGKDPHNLFATRCRTTQDLIKDWDNESTYIQLTIIARHSVSGINRVFKQVYHSKGCISTDKNFIGGNSLDIQ